MINQNLKPKSARKLKSNKNLTKVISQSELIKDMVQVCANDLSSVNTVLKEELSV